MTDANQIELIEILGDQNPQALLADGFEDAFMGFTVNDHHAIVAVYSLELAIQVLVQRDGMDEDEAREFIEFNTLGAYVGENGPLFVRTQA